jgi:CubicO group peptidase (beta-lactamase class C family)
MPVPTFGDPGRAKRVRDLQTKLHEKVEDYRQRENVPGIGYAVVVDREIVLSGGVGTRKVGEALPVDDDSVFSIGSITKVVTGMAVLKLRDEGKIDLDVPASRYLSELSEIVLPSADAREPTMRDLLTHFSGLPRLGDFDYTEHMPDEATVLGALPGLVLAHPPGEAYKYSNFGFTLLGIAVSRVAGVPYERYAAERILGPIGVERVAWSEDAIPEEHVAFGHRIEQDSMVTVPAWPLGEVNSAGGLFLSARDLGRLAAYQLDAWPARSDPEEGPLRRNTVRESQMPTHVRRMWVNDSPDELRARVSASGLAWGVSQDCELDHVVSHGGGTAGHRTFVTLAPRRGVAVVVLANAAHVRPGGFSQDLLRWIVDEAGLEPRKPRAFPEVAAAADALLERAADVDEPGLRALAEPAFMDRIEPEQLQADLEWFRDARGTCRRDGEPDGTGAWKARIDLACDRGTARLQLRLSPQSGKVRHFDLATVGGPASAVVRQRAGAAVSVIRRWNEKKFTATFHPEWPRGRARENYRKFTERKGACKIVDVQEAWRLGADFTLKCKNGSSTLRIAVDDDEHRIKGLLFLPAPEERGAPGRCH